MALFCSWVVRRICFWSGRGRACVTGLGFFSLSIYMTDLIFLPGMEVDMEPGIELDSMLLWLARSLPFSPPRGLCAGGATALLPPILSPLYPSKSRPPVGSGNLYPKGRGLACPYLFLSLLEHGRQISGNIRSPWPCDKVPLAGCSLNTGANSSSSAATCGGHRKPAAPAIPAFARRSSAAQSI